MQQQDTGFVDLWTSNGFFVGGAAVVTLLLVIYLYAALEV